MNSNQESRKFLRRFGALALGLVASVVLVNLAVDPWDRFGLNRLGVFISAAREFKLTEASRFPHDTLLLGNSRMAQIPASSLDGGKFFNAAFEGATLEEIRQFLERRLHGQRRVVLDLDNYLLGAESNRVPGDAFAAPSLRVLGGYLASLKALEYSLKTVTSGLAGRPQSFLADGTADASEWKRQRDVDDPAWLDSQLRAQRERLATFRFERRRLAELQAIAALVRQRGAVLTVFQSPLNEDLLPALSEGTTGTEWNSAVKAVRTLFPDVIDLTSSPFSARTNFYRTDPIHFYPEVGVRFLNGKVLGTGPPPR